MEISLKLPDQVATEDVDLQKFGALFQQMLNRMAFSHFKYGNMRDKYPDGAKAIDSARNRLEIYDGLSPTGGIMRSQIGGGDGNTEHLLDAANFLLIECLFPSHGKAHFEALPSSESPGIVYREE